MIRPALTVFILTINLVTAQDRLDVISNSDSNIYAIEIERDYLNSGASIYLYTNSIKSDSLKLHNLDFVIDSLVNHKNKFWHYIFSECNACAPSIEKIYQIVIIPKHQKLQITFVADYKNGRKKSPEIPVCQTNSLDSSLHFKEIKNQYLRLSQIVLDINFFNGNYWAEETVFSCFEGVQMEEQGFKKRYAMKFDKAKMVFYTGKKMVNGSCNFAIDKNHILKKRLNNEKIFLLKFYKTCFAYYNSKWYAYGKNTFKSLDLIFDICPKGCLQ